MTEDNAIEMIIEHINSTFPKKCPCCNMTFRTYREFLLKTTRIGKPISYDIEFDSGKIFIPRKIIGAISSYNCTCGSTMTIGLKGIGIINSLKLMFWRRKEVRRRHIPVNEILMNIQRKADNLVIDSLYH